MWSNNETSEDLPGFKVQTELLIDVINDDKVLTEVIGVSWIGVRANQVFFK